MNQKRPIVGNHDILKGKGFKDSDVPNESIRTEDLPEQDAGNNISPASDSLPRKR